MNTIAERAVAIGNALADETLPYGYLVVGSSFASISVMPDYSVRDRFRDMREVIRWAQAYSAELIISLSYGSGKAETNIDLGGVLVSVAATVGTAQAYELGRILQRELNRDVSIHIGADELLAAIDQAVTS